MLRTLLIIFLVLWYLRIDGQTIGGNQTYTYTELIEEYQKLDHENKTAKLIEVGKSDIGKPIHLFVLSKDQHFNPDESEASRKTIVFINNGIHPGEACGINASLHLAKDLLDTSSPLNDILDSVILVIVPIYNVGGMLNRGSYSRASQNGPEEHGFRGNAKNLDLNRDFIKCDSKNARAFTKVFRNWDPDIFIDTHTTNGSDHTYTLTLIASQKDKLNPVLSRYMSDVMLNELYVSMENRKKPMIPYVYTLDGDPKNGIKAFMETPRYSSGYAALFDCFAFITEAHSYKTFDARVEHTQAFLEELLTFSYKNNRSIKVARKEAKQFTLDQKIFPLKWTLDSNKYDAVQFKGFPQKKRFSQLLKDSIMYYDKERAYEEEIPFYSSYRAEVEVQKPTLYIIPQAYTEVIDRLKWNKIELDTLEQDETINVEAYYIEAYDSPKQPYEGHFLHTNMKVRQQKESIRFYAGDIVVNTAQEGVRYIIETLEPQSVDGFFAWNFFEGILQQKEWFSNFSFEEKAAEIISSNDSLRMAFNQKREEEKAFRESAFQQLYFIYKASKYYEPTVNRFPIYRFN